MSAAPAGNIIESLNCGVLSDVRLLAIDRQDLGNQPHRRPSASLLGAGVRLSTCERYRRCCAALLSRQLATEEP